MAFLYHGNLLQTTSPPKQDDPVIRRISLLARARLGALAAAAGALVLSACAGLPAEQTDAQAAGAAPAQPGTPNATVTPSAAANPARSGGTSYTDRQPLPPSNNDTTPTKTVTLPPKGRVSLAEYRAQMREQLMRTENASADVADCAAHASWVVPRSVTYDALRIPTGALAAGQATVERWDGRFSPGKQAVPVTSVVTFTAAAHRRNGEPRWDPVKVRCGYDDGMMLAYELLDGEGTVIAEPAARPAVEPPVQRATTRGRGGKSAIRVVRGKSSASKATRSSSSSKAVKSSGKSTAKATGSGKPAKGKTRQSTR